MSRITNYEAVAEIIGHWLHRAQVSLLTGAFHRQNRSIRVSNQVSHPASLCGISTGLRRRYVNMFEGPVTGNIPEVLDNGEVTDGTHVTAGQLALALTPYAQVTDLAVNTAASGNNAAAIQSLDDRVTAELASKLDSSALAPAIAPLATAAALATTDGRTEAASCAAELADHGPLQQGRPVGLRRAGGRGGHQEHPGRRGPEAVQLQHHGGHEQVHRLGQQRHAGHGGRQLRPQDGGGPALPGHSGEDHAAGGGHQGGQRSPAPPRRWPPSLRAETPPSRGCRPPRRTPAP